MHVGIGFVHTCIWSTNWTSSSERRYPGLQGCLVLSVQASVHVHVFRPCINCVPTFVVCVSNAFGLAVVNSKLFACCCTNALYMQAAQQPCKLPFVSSAQFGHDAQSLLEPHAGCATHLLGGTQLS